VKYLKGIFVSVLFVLLIFGIYKSIEKKEYGLSILTTSVLFMFALLMWKINPKNFHIGGDKLNVSVNQDNDDKPSE
jgi:Mn2+/Fe2+ NRAMP family transporter